MAVQLAHWEVGRDCYHDMEIQMQRAPEGFCVESLFEDVTHGRKIAS